MYRLVERHSIIGKEAYVYNDLCRDIAEFKKKFPNIPVFSIGKSVEGREIFAIKLGGGSRRLFINGAHHGMEWLTAKVCMELCKDFAVLPPQCCLYVVPMVNPDGIEIAARGYRWQANANGVDLNHNYDALWELSTSIVAKEGVNSPCASKFGGEFPESEPESRAVADFTRENNFDTVFALHSQGKVVYYDFCGVVPEGTRRYLDVFEKVSDYKRDVPLGSAVCGGYKDWFIKKFKRPGFTIEIGVGENPLPLSALDEVYGEVWAMFREELSVH